LEKDRDKIPQEDIVNILLIVTDQYRHDCMSGLQHPVVKTPHLDFLAAEGVMFTRSYCATMACGPSRASLFTGYYADTHGMGDNQVPLAPEDFPVLPEYLAQCGYDTALVGKLHLKPMARNFGFRYVKRNDAPYTNYSQEEADDSAYLQYLRETFFEENPEDAVRLFTEDEDCLERDELRFMLGSNFVDAEHHEASWTARESIRYLREERPKDRPFFLNCSFFGPHQPFLCPDPWDSIHPPEETPLPPDFDYPVDDKPIFSSSQHMVWRREREARGWDRDTYKKILSAYYGYVSMIDHSIGQLFQAMKEEGVWEDTLVIFTADHSDFGGQFRCFYKGLPYEGSTHVPLIIRDPRSSTKGKTCTRNLTNIDVFSTCLAAAGASIPADIESRDLAPLTANPDDGDWDDCALWKKGNQSLIVRGDFKLMRSGAKEKVDYEFYDLSEDPWEEKNRIDDPSCREDIDRLKQELDLWHREQNEKG